MTLAGKTVLITGGTGTFGHAFTRYLLAQDVRAVRIFSRDEYKQYTMAQTFTDRRMRWFLGDVRDRDRLHLAFLGVDVVVHAAALKHVPILEYNPLEAVKTNITGASNVVYAALSTGVDRVVALSTDKACAPVTLYGGTKFVAEKIFTDANVYRGLRDRPRFAVTRYGNVLGSRGSVLPRWREQLRAGESIGITDPKMTRFWMTIAEAVDLVALVIERMRGGEVFVPVLPSFHVIDLAEALDADKWRVTGLRGVEKLHESLIAADEGAEFHGTHYVVRADAPSGTPYTSDANTQWLDAEAIRARLPSIP